MEASECSTPKEAAKQKGDFVEKLDKLQRKVV